MQRKIMLINDEVAAPTVWSFLKTECAIEHITAHEQDLCTDCAANGKIWSALIDLGDVPDALAHIHEIAGQAIFDKLHQALHDSVCECGGAYGRNVGGKIEMLCERFKNRVCYIHDFCICAGDCCGSASCGCDENLCLCSPSSCYDGPSLRVLFGDDEENGPYPHVCGDEGTPVDEGACAARLMVFCAMEREESELMSALQSGEPRFSSVSGMVAQRAASIAGGMFLGDTLQGVPHNISTERVRRFFSCELSERDKQGLSEGTLAYQSIIRPAIVSFMDCIDEALRKSPLAEALRGEICEGACCVPGADAPQTSSTGQWSFSDAPSGNNAPSGDQRPVSVLSVINGKLTAPFAWAPALRIPGDGEARAGCGFGESTAFGIAYSGHCGNAEDCSLCAIAKFAARHALERGGTDMFFAQMEAIDAAIDVISKDKAERFAALCGGESLDCYGDLEYMAAGVAPAIVGAVSGCAAFTAMAFIDGVMQGYTLNDIARDIADMWSEALRETQICDETSLDLDDRKGRLAAYGAGVEMAQAIGARFAAGDMPGYAGDPAAA